MSLILKGIDLPSKDKSPLVITVWADGVVCSVDSNGGIEETTSAIQIPKGHGRIGDLDALENTINYDLLHRDEDDGFSTKSIWSYIKNAPTILEAEE